MEAFEPRAEGEGGVRVRTVAGDPLETDIVILAIGVRPEADLAKTAGLTLGARGGIRVDDRMQTSDPHIWAVGDVVEVRDIVTGHWQVVPLAGPQTARGALPLQRSSRPSGLRPVAPRVPPAFGASRARRSVASSGSLWRLPGRAKEPAARWLHRVCQDLSASWQPCGLLPRCQADTYEGALCADGRLLGAQAVGEEGVARRIDVIAMAMQLGGTVYDLEEAELCYAPQFGAAKDPINLAGMIAANHLRGDFPWRPGRR